MAKKAKKKAAPKRGPSSNLVRMVKDGKSIDVNPVCVAEHEKLGWKRD